MTLTPSNAKRLRGALLLAADAADSYVQMLHMRSRSEAYTNAFNSAIASLTEVMAQVSEDNKAAADDAGNAVSAAMLAELEAEADAEAGREEEEAELEAEIIARIEEQNAAAVEAIAVQNVADGLDVDDERFMDGINRAEGYLPPMSALSDAEVEEVERVLNDATPFPGCVTQEDGEAAEPVRVEPAGDTAASEAATKGAGAISANPFGGVDFGNIFGGHVPHARSVDGAKIFDYKPETD